MKIMVNATSAAFEKPTGIERFCLEITRELCRIDAEITVVAAETLQEIQTIIISKLLSYNNLFTNKQEFAFRALWDQTCFRYLVMKHKPDVVFFPIQDGLFFPSVKQIITVHDLHYIHFDKSMPECRHEINPLRTKFYQYKMPHILERSAAVVAVSESTKQEIVDVFGINPDKIHVIYNGYDDLRFRTFEKSQSILDRYSLQSGKYFLFVGSILKHKNISRLVQAFARLGNDVMLVVSGICKDAEYLHDVKKTAADLGIREDRLRYLEYVADDDLPYLYNGAISYLLPSLHEGFGVPIIEAMACGTPVITSNCSAMPEVAGDAALLVDPYSVESIAAALHEILDNPRRVDSLRTAGLERAKMFSWSHSAQKLYDVCRIVSET